MRTSLEEAAGRVNAQSRAVLRTRNGRALFARQSVTCCYAAPVSSRINELGQPIGPPLADWRPPLAPPAEAMAGRHCLLEQADASRHAADLFAECAHDKTGAMWTYLPYGPFVSFASFQTWLTDICAGPDPMPHAIIDLQTSRIAGLAAYMRITPKAGSIEVGHVIYPPRLQRATLATEAMYLMMKRAFDLGYRRYEWKCDALNAKSRAAAQRLGFSFEGIFRQALVYKGRSRDTAWFSVIDGEWPALNDAFQRWLDPANFDEHGAQRTRLSELTAPLLKARG